MEEQDPVCLGCHRSIEEGSVVAFGEGLWHVQCFRCAKCKSRVECDSNLLLLSDGSPICEQCSYSCSSCRRPILDEAIMTGDEAYHADCFRCTQCDSKIDDLVFAKTSQGIYCIKCHQERKEAKRQREERERMEKIERSIEKSLPTIPESETKHYQQHYDTSTDKRPVPDIPRIPQITHTTHNELPRNDSLPKANGSSLPSIDVGPPFLPPLLFGNLEENISGGFDLDDMLGGDSGKKSEDSTSATSSLSTKDVQIVNGQDRSSYRLSISRADAHLSTSSLSLNSSKTSLSELVKSVPSSPSSSPVVTTSVTPEPAKRISNRFSTGAPNDSPPPSEAIEENLSPAEAANLIKELRLELAKYNPMSPLIHGTPQQEYGLLLEKTEKLTQKHAQLEKSIRDLYIEKDLLGMDLEAMNEDLKTKEEALASNNHEKLSALPASLNPRMSTSHDFMKQAYQSEVKALQEQKERLQREIQTYVEQRDGVLDEMQILSVRNAELSTMNNDMMRGMHERGLRNSTQSAPASNPGAGAGAGAAAMLQSFTGKMRRNRQVSGGSHQELKASSVVRSGDSTYSFTSTNSENQKARREDIQEDVFGEEIITPKKFNWKMGGMFGGAKRPSDGTVASDNGSSNGQVLPPPGRSYSINSETGSLNGGRGLEQHYFIQHNFIKPTRCECCDDKLWGREYKCRNCGIPIHSRCTHEIIPGCSNKYKDPESSSLRGVTPSGGSGYGQPPTPPAKQIMFGNNLLDQLELEQRIIPYVVEACIEAVDQRGLEVEGIYRRSGMAAEARQLVQGYDVGLQPDLLDPSLYQDICSITSVLKQYLRSLPEPLIPYDLYDDFIDAVGLPHTDSKYSVFQDLLDRMPFAHYATLKKLLEHLNRVTENEHINLMTPKNLSVVFGPTLMRNPDPSREITDMVYKNMTIEFLIVNTSEIFIRSERPSFSSGNGENSPGSNGTSSDNLTVPGAQGAVTVAAAGGFPPGFAGQRQGSLTGITASPSPVLPPRRAVGHAPSPVLSQENSTFVPTLPPRSSSGDNIPTNQPQQQQPQQPHPHQQFHQQQQQQQQQQFYRPQQFMPPQHQTLQQLKQQQQQREQQQREQQQREQQQREQNAPSTPVVAAQTLEQSQQQQANPELDMSTFP